jgi:hypothetical protein
MNYYYIITLALVSIVAIYTFFNQDKWHNNHVGWRCAIGVISFIAMLVMVFVSFNLIGDETVETRMATSQRMGNEVIVQVNGWPTFHVTDIKYLDVPLKVTKTTELNAWGCCPKLKYFIDPVN